MAETTLSIIIPAYNVEPYLKEAIQSIKQQTSPPDEVIIIDDGSTDATLRIARSLTKETGYKVFTKENEGLGPTRNYGLKLANSKYVYFFDSDDIIPSHFVKTIKSIAERKEPEIIFFSGECFGDSSLREFPRYRRSCELEFTKADKPIRQLRRRQILYPSACLYVSLREIWLKYDLRFKAIVHEDEDIIFPLVSHAESILVTDETLFYRRIRGFSITTNANSIENLKGINEAIMTMEAHIRYSGYKDFERKEAFRRVEDLRLHYYELNKELSNTPFKDFFSAFAKDNGARYRARLIWRIVPKEYRKILYRVKLAASLVKFR